MTDMKTVDIRLPWFIGQMREKLSKPRNISKMDWRRDSADELLRKIEVELAELRAAFYGVGAVPDPAKIAAECADVSNFCFMLADHMKAAYPKCFEG